MFARRLRLTLHLTGSEAPVPAAWLEQFFMRDFTGRSGFENTLVAGDGLLETGLEVSAEAVQEQFEQWVRGRRMIPPEASVVVEETM